MLVEQQRTDAVPALQAKLKTGGHAALHSLWALEGLGKLDRETHRTALIATDPALRRNALRALGTNQSSAELLYDSATLADNDLHVRRTAFTALASLPKNDTHRKTASLLMHQPVNAKDEWLRAALAATGAAELNVIGYKPSANMLPNASFEKMGDNKLPSDWTTRTYSARRPDLKHAVETRKEYVRTGKHSLRISAETRHDSSLFARVSLKGGRNYILSGWVRTENLQGTATARFWECTNCNTPPRPRASARPPINGPKWREFKSEQDREVTVNCLFGGWGQSTGTAWWDDVSLVEITPIYREKIKDSVKGTVLAGKKIFDTHLVAGCIRCHKAGEKGGIIGPALDGTAARTRTTSNAPSSTPLLNWPKASTNSVPAPCPP